MNPPITSPKLELQGLAPDPGEEWRRMLGFMQLEEDDKAAMSETVTVLMQRAPELVINTYDYLRSVPETAAILGWEDGVDESHLEERRRFFTIWVARTLGLDTSEEFAYYLFRAGKFHAGHGPRRIHVPPVYVTGSIGLVQASFATYMAEANMPGEIVSRAMGGWSKYLSVQLHMMLMGYQVALDYSQGDQAVNIKLFGRMRALIGERELRAHIEEGNTIREVLQKFFSYYPRARFEALDRVWRSEDRQDSLWLEVIPAYVPRWGWRVLLNGRDVAHNGGFASSLHAGDEIDIFPPGR